MIRDTSLRGFESGVVMIQVNDYFDHSCVESRYFEEGSLDGRQWSSVSNSC